jgi:hypothetical protein
VARAGATSHKEEQLWPPCCYRPAGEAGQPAQQQVYTGGQEGERRGRVWHGGGNRREAASPPTPSEELKVLYTNAQSIVGKIDELCSVSCELDLDLILVTESWCNDQITNAFLSVPGYELITDLRIDRTSIAEPEPQGAASFGRSRSCNAMRLRLRQWY